MRAACEIVRRCFNHDRDTGKYDFVDEFGVQQQPNMFHRIGDGKHPIASIGVSPHAPLQFTMEARMLALGLGC